MKKQMLNKKGIGGITLIALVITIIVLLILAGVSIAMLTGENGILKQAQNAKTETEKAESKERIQLEVLASYGTYGKINIGTLKSNLAINVPEATVGTETELPLTVTVGDYTFKVKGNGTVEEVTPPTPTPPTGGTEAVVGEKVTGTENKTYTKNGTAVIPVGFAIVPGLDDVSEGLVISDNENDTELDADETKHIANGNQFVWVPVSKENFATEFVREHFGTEDQKKWWTGTFVTDGLSENSMYEPVADGINVDTTASESEQEVQKMYKSVKDNGGFYIARYEAGNEGGTLTVENNKGTWDDKGKVVSKKNVQVYNYIGWADTNDMTDETGGAVEVARGFSEANSYTSVTSTLVYGVQWDAVMRWINNDNNLKGYLVNSTPVGNYKDNDSTNNPSKTGIVKEYQLKNIYDMAGNVFEWTMESSETDARVDRGGSYNADGANNPVSYRGGGYPSGSYFVSFGGSAARGFRVALYL